MTTQYTPSLSVVCANAWLEENGYAQHDHNRDCYMNGHLDDLIDPVTPRPYKATVKAGAA